MSAEAVALTQNTPAIVLSAVSAANTAAATSVGVDLTGYEGVVSIVQQTGAITGLLSGAIQDSADNSVFAAVTGATFPGSIGTANTVNAVNIDVRNVRRYIRYVGSVITGPVLVSVVLNGFKKVKP